MTIKNIILDRDGVINQDSDYYVKNPDEFFLFDFTIDSLKLLYTNNIKLFIATNQSGINRQLYTLNGFISINNKMLDLFNTKLKNMITAVFYCPHTPEQNCNCRKPASGMIDKIKQIYNINLNQTAFIGDSLRDLQAGHSSGCKYNFLVKTGKGQSTYNNNIIKSDNNLISGHNSFDNLYSCVQYIINNNYN